jgi:membrane-associated protein
MVLLDAHEIILVLGTIGVLTVLFIETGLLIGLILPGDSLLFVAGFAASGSAMEVFEQQLSYQKLILLAPLAAIAGSQFGHWLGQKFGRPFFERPNSRIFSQRKVQQTERWFNRYGLGKALVLSHFIPIVRTLINPLCGIIGVPARRFFFWNVIGSYIWTVGLISGGFLLGEKLKGSVDKYLLPIVGIIIVLSLIPIFLELWRGRRIPKDLDH